MGFLSYVFFHSRFFIEISVVEYLFSVLWIELVAVRFLVAAVAYVFKCVPVKFVGGPIDYNSFEQRIASYAIFNSSNDLEAVFVELTYVSYCGCCPSLIFLLVFFYEGARNILKLMIINILKM